MDDAQAPQGGQTDAGPGPSYTNYSVEGVDGGVVHYLGPGADGGAGAASGAPAAGQADTVDDMLPGESVSVGAGARGGSKASAGPTSVTFAATGKKGKEQTVGAAGFQASLTLINSVVGAGVLALGDTFSRMGSVCAIILLLISAAVVYFSFRAINEATYYTKARTFRQLLVFIFGDVFAMVVDVCNVVILFSYLITYIAISSQYALAFLAGCKAFSYSYEECYLSSGLPCWKHYVAVAIITLCVLVPLVCFRSLNFLNKISSLSLVMVVITAVCFVVLICIAAAKHAPVMGTQEVCPPYVKLWPHNFPQFMVYAPFLISLYVVHSSLSPMFSNMHGKDFGFRLKAMQIATHIAVPLCTALYLIMGFVGSSMFEYPRDNLLNGFDSGFILILILRLCMAVVVMVSYPAIMLPVRTSILTWIKYDENNKKVDNALFYGIGLGLVALSMIIAMVYPNIGDIFSYASSIFGIFSAWIAPLMVILYMPRIRALGKPTTGYRDQIHMEESVMPGVTTSAGSEAGRGVGAPSSLRNAMGEDTTTVTSTADLVAEHQGADAVSAGGKPRKRQPKPKKKRLPPVPLGIGRQVGLYIAMAVATVLCLVAFVCQVTKWGLVKNQYLGMHCGFPPPEPEPEP